MKKFYVFLTAIILAIATMAQAPAGINYQTVIRDGDGNILPDAEISLQMTIRSGAPDGEVVYQETHNATTNAFGLVNLVIGGGTPQTGDFATIAWGKNSHYLQTAIDADGSGTYTVLGTTQFLSVPYANFSGATGGILTMTTQERNALQNPPVGMQIYNTTTDCLNYYNGSDWYETCGELVVNLPPVEPYEPYPPDGTYDHPLEISFSWQCSDPDLDPLTYDLYMSRSGEPELVQAGITTNSYFVSDLYHTSYYQWKVVAHDGHGNSTESPIWNFETIYCDPPQVNAGSDATICEDTEYMLNGSVIMGEDFIWTCSGDGTFSDPLILDPIYYPGPDDIQNGAVWLTLTATAVPPCPPMGVMDEMILTIIPNPTAYAGPDQTVCEGDEVILDAIAENYSDFIWFTPNGTGDFGNENQLSTYYTPGLIDYLQGITILGINATPISPCSIVADDQLTVTYTPLPETDAGADMTSCGLEPLMLDGSESNACGLEWTTSGDGTFSEPDISNPVYYPGPGDVGNVVTLTLSGWPCDPCTTFGTDAMQLFVQQPPQVDAGEDMDVCWQETVQLSGSATGTYVVLWTTINGLGDIVSPNTLTTIYYPSPMDYMVGYTDFKLQGNPVSPCTISDIDTVRANYFPIPEANAGPNQTDLPGTSTTLEGNAPPAGGSGLWTISSGTGGSIAEPTNPTSTFTGQAGESYTLTWTLTNENGCQDADEVNISFASNCGQPFTDTRDGQQYGTVQIGDQCWMKENLAYLPSVSPSSQGNNTDPYYYVYGYQGTDVAEAKASTNYQTYGVLYNWPASLDACPVGWHLPTDAEWTTLTDYVSSQPEYNCNGNTSYIAKALAATTNWNSYSGTCAVGNNLSANNASGFSGLPGGYRLPTGNFYNIGPSGTWWSSTEYSSTSAWYRGLFYTTANVYRNDFTKGYGFSVRCLRD